MPRFAAKVRESSTLPLEEYSVGIVTPSTFSAPRASAARHATIAESIPPLNPSTADLKPHLCR